MSVFDYTCIDINAGQVRVFNLHIAVVAHACHGHRYRGGGGEGEGSPALAGTREYEHPTGIGSRPRVFSGVMEFVMSRRIKPSEKYVCISNKGHLAQFGASGDDQVLFLYTA